MRRNKALRLGKKPAPKSRKRYDQKAEVPNYP